MRIRKHTDGRIAVERVDHAWSVHDGSDPRWPAVRTAHTDDVIGEGWVELYTAVLPEPDEVGEASTPQWIEPDGTRITAYISGVLVRGPNGVADMYRRAEVELLRATAHRTLAAITAYDDLVALRSAWDEHK